MTLKTGVMMLEITFGKSQKYSTFKKMHIIEIQNSYLKL